MDKFNQTKKVLLSSCVFVVINIYIYIFSFLSVVEGCYVDDEVPFVGRVLSWSSW